MDVANTIYNRLTSQGIPPLLAGFITAQSAHETGGWTSAVFNDCHNCFGYKWVGQSTAAGPCNSHSAYAAYNSIADSVDEIVYWIARRQQDGSFPDDLTSITSSDQYAALLKNADYYGDTLANYAAGIRSWLSQLSLTQKVGGGVGILALLLGVYLLRKKLFKSGN